MLSQQVDLWGVEDNYVEPGMDTKEAKNKNLRSAKRLLYKWKNVTEYFVMRSTDAAKRLKDNYFDYIYVDARHDYCAVLEDMDYYWPKRKPGGIMGGHDYVTAEYASHEDWSKCENGTIETRAVQGAVQDFSKQHGNLLIRVTGEPEFAIWVIQQPYDEQYR